MVISGPEPVLDLTFQNPVNPAARLDVLTLREQRRRASAQLLQSLHRVDFHQLMLVTAGRDRHLVDFVEYECSAGDVLWVHPGQTQRYLQDDNTEGVLLLFTQEFVPQHPLLRRLLDPFGPVYWSRADEADRAISRSFQVIVDEDSTPGPEDQAANEVFRSLLVTLLLRLARAPEGHADDHGSRQSQVFVLFRRQVESSFATVRNVESYARPRSVRASGLMVGR